MVYKYTLAKSFLKMHVKKTKKKEEDPELCLQTKSLFASISEFPIYDINVLL